MNEFEGRVAIVTGASSGTGRAVAEKLIAGGASVAVIARRRDRLHDLEIPGRVVAYPLDVADTGALARAIEDAHKRFGRCDILVNCAGMIDPLPLEQTSIEQWDRMFAVNVRSIFAACRAVLPIMKQQGSGAIVNVASISGIVGPEKFPGFVSYCASKGAVISLTEALAVEVKEHGIRVNSVSPGSVDTAMWSKASGGALAEMTPQEVAETILFLASDRSRPINGQDVHVFSA